jgi:hypothetical protein
MFLVLIHEGNGEQIHVGCWKWWKKREVYHASVLSEFVCLQLQDMGSGGKTCNTWYHNEEPA